MEGGIETSLQENDDNINTTDVEAAAMATATENVTNNDSSIFDDNNNDPADPNSDDDNGDGDGDGDVAVVKKMSFIDATIVISTFALAGAIIAVPYSFGQFGYILGSIVFLAVIGLMLFFLNFLVDVADSCCDNDDDGGEIMVLGDVGFKLGGSKGRLLFQTFQMTNLILYLPLGLETIGISLNYIVNGNCESLWNIISIVALYALLQCIKFWHHVAWVAYFTFFLAATKALIFLPWAYVEYRDEIISSSSSSSSGNSTDYYLGPVEAFGNPQPTWYNYCVALTGFFYTFPVVFILFEVRSGMQDPKQCKKALNTSAAIQVVLYLVSGLTGVAMWGWNVADPITIEIPRGSWLGLFLNIVVVLATALDYFIAAKICNEWFRNTFLPTSSNKETIVSRLIYTFPTSLFAIICVLFIPDFDTMIGLLTSITIMGMSTWVSTVAWEWGGRRYTKVNRFIIWIFSIIGLACNAAGLAGSIYEIVTADYSFQLC